MAPTKLDQFTRYIMPDAPVGKDAKALSAFTANPAELPEGSEEILNAVQCQTGVPMKYLEHAVGLVLRGVAGLKCLWFLHGLEGQIKIEHAGATVTPDRPWVSSLVQAWLSDVGAAKGRYSFSAWHIDWREGSLGYTRTDNKTGVSKGVNVKLGKVLKEAGATKEQLKEFETRIKPAQTHWVWKISAHPFDVLTMSFGRSWTSCMRPGGPAQFGPLTDMAAGSACLFWYRPGADEPCGRTILRPFVEFDPKQSPEYRPCVNIAPTVKGAGPRGEERRDIEQHIRRALVERDGGVYKPAGWYITPDGVAIDFTTEDHELLGQDGMALSRNIYDDYSTHYCSQDDDVYADAYSKMSLAPWPEPRLSDRKLDELRALVTPEMLFETGEDGGAPVPEVSEVVAYFEHWLENMGLSELLSFYSSEDHVEELPEEWQEVSEHIDWNEVNSRINEITRDHIGYHLSEDTYAVIVPVDDPLQMVLPGVVEAPALYPSDEYFRVGRKDPWTEWLDKHSVIGSYGTDNLVLELDQGHLRMRASDATRALEWWGRQYRPTKQIGPFLFVGPPPWCAAAGDALWKYLREELGWPEIAKNREVVQDYRVILAQPQKYGRRPGWEALFKDAPGGSWIAAWESSPDDEPMSYQELYAEFGDELFRSTVIVNVGREIIDDDMWVNLLAGPA
jgi:hypothetical protein